MMRDIPDNIALEPLFSSAHAALTFALNFSSQQYGKSAMSIFAAPGSIGSGKGLGGLDGAAQAGMIRRELASCGKIAEAILIGRCAPKSKVCECTNACCSGRIPNDEYVTAANLLCDEAMVYLSCCLSHYGIRRGIIDKFYGEKIRNPDLAEKCGVALSTVNNQEKRILAWLKGESRDNPGAEYRAWRLIEERLIAAGMIAGEI